MNSSAKEYLPTMCGTLGSISGTGGKKRSLEMCCEDCESKGLIILDFQDRPHMPIMCPRGRESRKPETHLTWEKMTCP